MTETPRLSSGFRRAARPSGGSARAALCFVIALACAAPAAADRHCYPALDGYFAARQPLLDETLACAPALAAARADLEAAVADARICGCTPVIALMQTLRDAAGDPTDCAKARALILGAEAEVEAAVHDCHH